MRLNTVRPAARTHEGAKAYRVSPELSLRRAVMACLLWESQFYESGKSIADRIEGLIPQVHRERVCEIAIEAREKMKLRHVPLLIACGLAKIPGNRQWVADLVGRVIQRPDELTELLAIYSRGRTGRKKLGKLSGGIKDGIAAAFPKFDAYQLAKYDRPGEIRLRDALFLSHAKPRDEGQAEMWRQLVAGELASPDTWEVALSSGADKRETWESLLSRGRLGALALLRNLRNMLDARVDESLIVDGLRQMKVERVLPFRFISAARHAVQLEPEIETAMLRCLASRQKLPGKTALLVDHSYSMVGTKVSKRSEIDRFDAACGLAILCRELCEQCRVFAFSTSLGEVAPRRGFALRDAVKHSVEFGNTYLGEAVEKLDEVCEYDRLIVITDEQSHDKVRPPKGKGYMLNVGSYENGVGYGSWVHIDGWSESVLDYIRTSEEMAGDELA